MDASFSADTQSEMIEVIVTASIKADFLPA
jgi:hypothetical protein